MPVSQKLERMGLVFFTEEEPFDLPGDPLDGFQFSCEIYMQCGQGAGAAQLRKVVIALVVYCIAINCN